MNRLALAFATIAALAGCGSKKTFGSICTDDPPPATCGTACDPAGANSCGAGFHCSADGACDAQCNVGGTECGDGYHCTTDGYCEGDDVDPMNGPDASCPAINFTPMPTTPSIGLVLDQSGSMAGQDISPNRYTAMRNALVDTMNGVVTQLETKAYFGSELYTCANNALALQTVPRALNNAAAIRLSIDNHQPAGNTPTAAALDSMVAAFAATPPPAGSPPAIVIATDGEPNSCDQNLSQSQYNAQSVASAAAAYAAGIPVYVLAINTGNNTHFQDLANAGQGHQAGQPNITYYPVTSAAQLKQAFDTIINGIISCDLTLTSTIDDNAAMQGTVTVNGMNLTYGTDWVLVNGNIIRLQGQACTDLKSSANPTVTASFPCGSVIF